MKSPIHKAMEQLMGFVNSSKLIYIEYTICFHHMQCIISHSTLLFACCVGRFIGGLFAYNSSIQQMHFHWRFFYWAHAKRAQATATHPKSTLRCVGQLWASWSLAAVEKHDYHDDK